MPFLFALPRGLQADVARRVALQWRPHVWLPPEAIILAATHTHQGPGNYMTASTYNDFGSFVPGFSKKLFDFLSDRIADAVNMAIARAISDPGGAELLVRTASVDASAGLQLNRSPRTFFLNWNRLGIMDALSGTTPLPAGECDPARSEPRDAWDLEGCPRLRAVDPNITLLQVRRAGATTGVLVFFAAHPTTLIHTAPFYSADFAGYAVSMLEREWPVSTEHPVIGFFNGAEGDVVPRRLERDLKDVTRIGEQFRTAIVGVLNTGTTRTLTLGSIKVGREIIRPANNTACTPSGSTEPIRIAKNPVFGAAALGGAEGDRTSSVRSGLEGRCPRHRQGSPGRKLPALDSQLLRQIHLTSLLAPPESFPSELPVSYADSSGLELAAFPAEISTEEGIAIRRQLGIDAGLGHGQLELIGLADEYTSYVASPSEYALQDYMGASTIWGPQEGPFFACTAGNLKLTVDGSNDLSGTTHVDRLTFSPGQAGDGKVLWPGLRRPAAVGTGRGPRKDPHGQERKSAAGAAVFRMDGDGRPQARRLRHDSARVHCGGCVNAHNRAVGRIRLSGDPRRTSLERRENRTQVGRLLARTALERGDVHDRAGTTSTYAYPTGRRSARNSSPSISIWSARPRPCPRAPAHRRDAHTCGSAAPAIR